MYGRVRHEWLLLALLLHLVTRNLYRLELAISSSGQNELLYLFSHPAGAGCRSMPGPDASSTSAMPLLVVAGFG